MDGVVQRSWCTESSIGDSVEFEMKWMEGRETCISHHFSTMHCLFGTFYVLFQLWQRFILFKQLPQAQQLEASPEPPLEVDSSSRSARHNFLSQSSPDRSNHAL